VAPLGRSLARRGVLLVLALVILSPFVQSPSEKMGDTGHATGVQGVTSRLSSQGHLTNEIRQISGGRSLVSLLTNCTAARVVTSSCAHEHSDSGATPLPNVQWTNLTGLLPISPPCRGGAAMSKDPPDDEIVLFGGTGSTETPCGPNVTVVGDSWAYTAGGWEKLVQLAGSTPSNRTGAVSAFDPALGCVVLFGGQDVNLTPLNDTWEFCHGAWTQLSAGNEPPARSDAAATYDPQHGGVLLFGGTDGTCCLGDTWLLTNNTWSQLSASGPGPRRGATMFYDPTTASVVLFGGRNNVSALGDTWNFVRGGWQRLSTGLAPPGRWESSADWDQSLNATVLFGGCVIGYFVLLDDCTQAAGDTWLYRLGQWISLSPRLNYGPSPRGSMNLAFDPSGGYAIVFGGTRLPLNESRDTHISETWALALNLTGLAAGGNVTTDLGLNVTFSGQGYGGVPPLFYRWEGIPEGCSATIGPTLTCSPTTIGTYAIIEEVSDFGGHLAVSPEFRLLVNPRLNAIVGGGPRHADLTTQEFFTGVLIGGTPPVSSLWLFGDGSSSSLLNVTHLYPSAGTYDPALVVTDHLGMRIQLNVLPVLVFPALMVTHVSTTAEGGARALWVRLDANVAGGDMNYTFDWAVGPSGSFVGSDHLPLEYQFSDPGDFQGFLIVTDGAGGEVSIPVTANPRISSVDVNVGLSLLVGGAFLAVCAVLLLLLSGARQFGSQRLRLRRASVGAALIVPIAIALLPYVSPNLVAEIPVWELLVIVGFILVSYTLIATTLALDYLPREELGFRARTPHPMSVGRGEASDRSSSHLAGVSTVTEPDESPDGTPKD
jgi:PKD domain-containing protein/galactose oxidase-like protein